MDSYLLDYVLYFIVYSFVGWLAEVVFVYIKTGKFINCGLLYGPFLPIYGSGALGAVVISQYLNDNYLLIFISSALISSIIEYSVHYVLEKSFNLRLWDYSDKVFNLNGRICLEYASLFGIGSLALVVMLHPWAEDQIVNISQSIKLVSISLFVVYFILDWAMTLVALGKVSYVKRNHPELIKYLRHRRQSMDDDFSNIAEEVAEKTKNRTILIINTTAYVASMIIKNIKFNIKK